MAAVDYFLKIDGVEGESTVKGHEGEIDLMSFSWGETHAATVGGAGGGGSAGRVQMQDFHFTKGMDKSSPLLFLKVANGAHIASAKLYGTRPNADGAGLEFLKFVLSDVLVSSYQTGGDGSAIPTDQFSLNFAKIEVFFTPNSGDQVRAGWDLKANRAV